MATTNKTEPDMTKHAHLYPGAAMMAQVIQYLDLPVDRVMRRAGVSIEQLGPTAKGITQAQYFALWEALYQEYGGNDLAVKLGSTVKQGSFVPHLFAFSCSPNIEEGVKRLALFKPLIAPIRLEVERTDSTVSILFTSSDPSEPFPEILAQFEIIYFTNCSRTFTGEPIVPLSVGGPVGKLDWSAVEAECGVKATPAPVAHITLSLEDATRPLITQMEGMWDTFEDGLRQKLKSSGSSDEMSRRVKNALLESLPAGQNTIEVISQRLNASKRTLQRKLKEEGKSFQDILSETRSELSQHYLVRSDLSIPEISYLLGYKDTGSFFRAFQSWTGKTPMEVRGIA
ncbi:AraC family transcriptional regulator ligand-binding domain-containing protein [Pseudovibrio denitrificans]|uniref:AraC family transcriptional regulator n=1 Tax=Pseudovibrio denitrificans TaxID=258256 RepID=UPI0039BF85B7